MVTLHIEHAITDYPTWRGAFDRFAAARGGAGAGLRVSQTLDDPAYIVVDLDFATSRRRSPFASSWRSGLVHPERSPALVGQLLTDCSRPPSPDGRPDFAPPTA